MVVVHSELSLEVLHAQALSIRRSQTVLNWDLAMCLRSLEKAGAFAKLECSSVEMYARTRLNMNPHKASELLRAARRLETAPVMAEAFRRGDLTWSKVRELTRHVTPETDSEMTKWALVHTAEEIQRSMVISPRRFQHEQDAATGTTSADTGGLAGSPMTPPTGHDASLAEAAPAQLMLTSQSSRGEMQVPARARSGFGSSAVKGTATIENSEESVSSRLPGGLAKKRLIGITVYIEPEEYALFQKAKSKVYARLGKRVPMSAVVRELCTRYLTTGSAQSNLKHQVHVHVDTEAGSAWVETDRGPLAVSMPAASGCSGKPTQRQISGSAETGCAKPEGDPNVPAARKPSRRIPNAMLQQVVRRAQGRCETSGCGKTTNLQVHHVNPFSAAQEHRLEDLRLLCSDCHHVTHLDDFNSRALWRYARAIRSRNSHRTAPASKRTIAGDDRPGCLDRSCRQDLRNQPRDD